MIKKRKTIFLILVFGFSLFWLFYNFKVLAGTLSCTITSSSTCSGVVILRMSSSTNAHAELPNQSNPNYSNNVICCSGVSGLSNTCSDTYAVVLKLSKQTNAHVEENNQTNYSYNACLSVPTGGSVSVGYQINNCDGYDTTLASISGVTNAHIGNPNAYSLKVCASAASGATISCNLSATSTSFGNLSPSSVITSNPNITLTSSCTSNNGCTIYINDRGDFYYPGLYKASVPTYLISSSDATLTAGTEGYGIQATTTSSVLILNPKYNKSGNQVGGLTTEQIVFASSSTSYNNQSIVIIHKASISNLTPAGNYQDLIIYSCYAN